MNVQQWLTAQLDALDPTSMDFTDFINAFEELVDLGINCLNPEELVYIPTEE